MTRPPAIAGAIMAAFCAAVAAMVSFVVLVSHANGWAWYQIVPLGFVPTFLGMFLMLGALREMARKSG